MSRPHKAQNGDSIDGGSLPPSPNLTHAPAFRLDGFKANKMTVIITAKLPSESNVMKIHSNYSPWSHVEKLEHLVETQKRDMVSKNFIQISP